MNRIIVAVFIAVLISLLSCQKNDGPDGEEVYDTIRPLSYFPAYPGSWWAYNTGDTLKTKADYQLYTYISECGDFTNTRTLVLPQFHSNKIYGSRYIYEYLLSNPLLNCYYPLPFIQILSDTLGQVFIKGEPDFYQQTLGKTIVKDTTLTINGRQYENVIITIEFDRGCSEGSDYTSEQCATMREYYAKGIGLIKREKGRNLIFEEWTTEYELIDFFINKN